MIPVEIELMASVEGDHWWYRGLRDAWIISRAVPLFAVARKTLRSNMPNWKHKVLIQRLLAKIPFGEDANRVLQLLWRLSTFSGRNSPRSRWLSVAGLIRRLSAHLQLQDSSVVEVGTGWIPLPSFLLYLAGAREIRTFDIVRRARWRTIRSMIRVLRNDIHVVADAMGQPCQLVEQRLARIQGATSMQEMLDLAHITYIAPGISSATGLRDGSVDLFFAYSVFEYFPIQDLHALCREVRRLLRPETGRLCAVLGCGDDYAGFDPKLHILDYLRYSDEQWDRMVNNGNRYYYNRVREQEFLDILGENGVTIDAIEHTLKPEHVDYVKRIPLAERFRRFSAEQNAVVWTEVIASHAAVPPITPETHVSLDGK